LFLIPFSVVFFYTKPFSRFCLNYRQRLAAWRSGGGTQKLGRATKLLNSHKNFREHTPRMTPNRLLGAGLFFSL